MAPASYDLAWTWLLLRFPPMIVPAALRSAAPASRLDDLDWHRGLHSCRVLIDLALWKAQEDPPGPDPSQPVDGTGRNDTARRRGGLTLETSPYARAMAMVSIGLVLDCRDPQTLAPFWAEALGYVEVGSAGAYVLLVDPDGVRPKLLLQAVPETKTTKNRMHLDIDAEDIEAEAARLEALGASRLAAEPRHEHGTNWILLADPEGNELCVCDGGAAS